MLNRIAFFNQIPNNFTCSFFRVILIFLLSFPVVHEGFSAPKNSFPKQAFRVLSGDTVFIWDTICSANLPYVWGGQNLISTGTYFHTTQTPAGDSTAWLFLTVIPSNPIRPTRPQSSSRILCSTQEAQFSTTTSSPALQWQLIPAGCGQITGPSNKAQLRVQWTAGFSGPVKIIAKSRNRCGLSQASDTLSVWVLPLNGGKLPAPHSSDTLICIGTAFSVAETPFPAQQFLWSVSPPNAGSATGSGDSVRINWNTSFSGLVVVSYSSLTPCGLKFSDTLRIRIRPRAVSGILNLDSIYCERNAQVNLQGFPPAGQFFINDIPASGLSIASPGIFQVRYQPVGCFLEAGRTVRVQARVQAFITSNDTLVCAGPEIHPLTGIPAGGQFLVNGQQQVQFQAPLPGIYNISYQAFCTDTARLRVRAISLPDARITLPGPGFCTDTLPAAVQLEPAGGQFWVDGIPRTAFIPDAVGLHTLIYRISASNCYKADTVAVSVDSRPELILSLDRPELLNLCRRDSAVRVHGWPENGFFSSPAIQNSILNPALLPPGKQYIYYLGYNGVCLDSVGLQIRILDVPVVEAGIYPDSLCEDAGALSLGQASPPGGIWSGTGVSGNQFFPERPGPHYLVYSLPAQDTLRCAASDVVRLFVKNKPRLDFGRDTSICIGESIRMGEPGGDYLLLWNDGSNDREKLIKAPGVYFFRAGSGECSWNSDTLRLLSLRPVPAFSLGPDRSECIRDSVKIPGPPGMKLYRWYRADELVSTDSVFSLDLEGALSLTVTAQNNCSFTDQAEFTAAICPEIFIPEAFSPDEDGINENWKVFGANIRELSINVFNAWGELVFDGRGKDAIWDGRFRGKPCPPGAYRYVIQYSGSASEKGGFSERISGEVFIIRQQ